MGNKLNKKIVFSNPHFPFNMLIAKIEKPMPVHEHDFYEVGVVLKGNGIQHINNNETSMKKGDVFVLKGNDKHYISSHQGLEICYLQFDESFFMPYWYELRLMKGFQNLFILQPHQDHDPALKSIMSLNPEELDRCHEKLLEMFDEFRHEYAGYQTRIIALFSELVVYLSRMYEKITLPKTGMFRLSDAVIYMEQFYYLPISIQELASKSQLSLSAFSKLFRKVYKYPPLYFLNQIRINRACRLLHSTELSITEIAEKTGFDDLNYFSRKFRQIKGLTPKEFRKSSK